MEELYKSAWEKIKNADVITIFGHVIPDGDCYGSELGMKNAILENFPDKKVYALGSGLPRFFSLVGEMDQVDDEVIKNSLALVLDVANIARIEDQRYKLAKEIVKIDHHLLQDHFGDVEIIINDKISCTEIITEMLVKLNIKFGPKTALPLFLGLVTDSGRFLYQPINADTYNLAASLASTGIDIGKLYDVLYEVDEKILRFKGYIFSHYKKTKNGVIYLTIPKEVVHEHDLDYNTCASLVNSVANIKGSPIWVFFSESDNNEVRVEFRSKGVPVQPTAVKFGGGGHLQASGCKLSTLDDYELVVKELDKVLGEYLCSKKN